MRENWQQFSLLVVINAFVGGMVRLERIILPRIAEQEFYLVARSVILLFIAVFGLTKAVANYYAGAWAIASAAATCCSLAGCLGCRSPCYCFGPRTGVGSLWPTYCWASIRA